MVIMLGDPWAVEMCSKTHMNVSCVSSTLVEQSIMEVPP